jgi:regulatory protein
MKITSLESQKKRANRVSIFIDGAFSFGMSLDALATLGLRKGQSVTEEELEQWKTTTLFDEAKNAAFAILARRIHSEKEVRTKLRRKDFPPEIIDKAIIRLYELKLLNDADFANVLVRDKLKRTPIGKSALQSKLYQKGINKETIAHVLAETDLHADELCLKAAEKKLRSLTRETDDSKKQQKLVQFLARRGFDWDTIKPAVKKVLGR